MAITRFRNSSIRNGTPKYNDFLAGLPFRPAIGTATAGTEQATVAFTANNPAGAGVTYTALSSPGNITATGPASPITVTGLTGGTAYTFQVRAGNSLGDSAYSASSNSVTPAVATAFESIATATASGSSQEVTFSSIPGTYKHLQIRGIMRSTEAGSSGTNVYLRTNGDTGSNYAYHGLNGSGAVVSASGSTSQTNILVGRAPAATATANIIGVVIIDIQDYASTSKNKTFRIFAGQDQNSTAGNIALRSGVWLSTSAITSLTLINENPNFSNITTFALYGIKG